MGDPRGVCQPGRHRLPRHHAGRTGKARCRPDRRTPAPWTRRAHLAPLRGSPATLDPSPRLPDARTGVTRTRAHPARLALGARIPPRSDAVHGAAPTACVSGHGTEPLRVGRSPPADYPGDARGLAASPGRGRRFFPSEESCCSRRPRSTRSGCFAGWQAAASGSSCSSRLREVAFCTTPGKTAFIAGSAAHRRSSIPPAPAMPLLWALSRRISRVFR